VVRDSIIQLTKETFKEYKVEERPFKITELLERHKKGQVEEIFCSGTAAVISPVDLMTVRGIDINLDTKRPDSFSS
jgi:branched-chain amino acid aminotransferase